MNILYFAWVREKVGVSQENVSPPASVETVAQLIDWLSTQSPKHADAFKNPTQIRAAVDQVHSAHAAKITGANEVAFFPPVTGG